MSEVVLDIISNITGFITYFAPGYILLSCFNYASCRQRETDKEYLVIKSISLSYLMFVVISYIGNKLNIGSLTVQFITFLMSLIIGLLFGKLSRIKILNYISLFIFHHEIHNNFFVELGEKASEENCVVCVMLTLKDDQGVYEGQLSRVLSYNDDPNIILTYYCCYDNEMHVLFDYSNIENSFLLIKYSDIQKFEYELISAN